MIYIAMAQGAFISIEKSLETRRPKNTFEIIHHYSNLYHLRKFCENIDQIILLNFEDLTIKEEDLDNYLTSDMFPHRNMHESKDELESNRNIISKMKIFNKEDLGIIKDNNYINLTKYYIYPPKIKQYGSEQQIDEFLLKNMNLSSLKKIINNKPLFTFDASLLFLRILSELENVVVYRQTFRLRQEKTIIDLIAERNVKAYYQFRINLQKPIRSPYDKTVPSNFLTSFKNKAAWTKDIEFSPNAKFFADFSSLLSGSIKKAVLLSSDDFIIKYMIASLEKKPDIFSRPNIASLNAEGTLSGNRILIEDANKLNVNACNKVIAYANSGEQKNKIILLQSGIPVKALHDTSFKVILLPSKEQIEYVLPKILLFIIKNKFPDSLLWKLGKKSIQYLNKPTVREIFRKIPTLTEIENEFLELDCTRAFALFNFRDPDFWWEFKNYIDEQYPTTKEKEQELDKALEEKKELVKEKKTVLEKESNQEKDQETKQRKKKNITFEHVGNFWKITSSGFKSKIEPKVPEPYNDNLALKYLTYLVQYYENQYGESDNYIAAEVLYKQVRKWNKTAKKSKKPNIDTVYSQIESYFNPKDNRNKNIKIRNFREQLGKNIGEYFVWEKYCYYNPPKDFDIIVKFDKEMEKYKINN